jgi:hypothetical protein
MLQKNLELNDYHFILGKFSGNSNNLLHSLCEWKWYIDENSVDMSGNLFIEKVHETRIL